MITFCQNYVAFLRNLQKQGVLRWFYKELEKVNRGMETVEKYFEYRKEMSSLKTLERLVNVDILKERDTDGVLAIYDSTGLKV